LGEWVEDEPGGESDLDVAGIPSVRRRRRLGTSWLTMRLLLGQQEVSELSRLAGVGEALGTPCDQDWTGPVRSDRASRGGTHYCGRTSVRRTLAAATPMGCLSTAPLARRASRRPRSRRSRSDRRPRELRGGDCAAPVSRRPKTILIWWATTPLNLSSGRKPRIFNGADHRSLGRISVACTNCTRISFIADTVMFGAPMSTWIATPSIRAVNR